MSSKELRRIERRLMRTAGDLDELRCSMSLGRIRGIGRSDRLWNLASALASSVRRIEICVGELRVGRTRKL